MSDRYPEEQLNDEWEDDGTMPANVAELEQALIGRRIVSAEKEQVRDSYWPTDALVLTLDDGTRVEMLDSGDCCAYTELQAFLLNPEAVDHAILGVGTTDQYTTWHIFADFGDVMKLTVGWSAGNPFYYAYGFDIRVVPARERHDDE